MSFLTTKSAPGPEETVQSQHLTICIAAETYAPEVNGAAKFAQRLANGLAQRGHRVHVVCPSPSGYVRTELMDNVRVHYVKSVHWPLHPTWMITTPWWAKPAVHELFEQIQPDVVHTQAHFVVGRYAIKEAVARNIPLVATNHFMPDNVAPYVNVPAAVKRGGARAAWWDLRRTFEKADYLTVPTQLAADLLTQSGFRRQIHPVSCGIDLSHFHKATAGETLPATDPTALFVGRLSAEKHIEDIIEAVAASNPALNIQAEIIGAGEHEQFLRQLAAQRGVADRVHFLGKVSEEQLVAAYQRATFFCMPSTAELQSIATLEALSSAKPVVLANAVALPHLVRDGENGFLIQPHNIPDYVDAFEKLAQSTQAELARMGGVSQEIARGHDLQATLDAFENIYRTVIANKQS